MSCLRSRKAGKRKQAPLIRKYNSRRKRPASISCSRSRDVVEIRRANGLDLPLRGASAERKESKARWQSKSRSCTSSRNSVICGEPAPWEAAADVTSSRRVSGVKEAQLNFTGGLSEACEKE